MESLKNAKCVLESPCKVLEVFVQKRVRTLRKLPLIRSPGLYVFVRGFKKTYKQRGLYPRGFITGIVKVLRKRL